MYIFALPNRDIRTLCKKGINIILKSFLSTNISTNSSFSELVHYLISNQPQNIFRHGSTPKLPFLHSMIRHAKPRTKIRPGHSGLFSDCLEAISNATLLCILITLVILFSLLFIIFTLPSGRQLAYAKPRIGENQFGGDCVTYMGVEGTKKWEWLESYGPKFVENIVQAISRDILVYAVKTLRCCSNAAALSPMSMMN